MTRADVLRLGVFVSGIGLFAGAARADEGGYATMIKPLLDRHCVECHHDGGRKPDLSAFPFPGVAEADQEAVVQKMLSLVEASPAKMPPGLRTKLTAAEIEAVKDWLDQGLTP